ncbi:MAG: hypothetical protein AB7Q97_25400 [Gammaproteobacteria bacterium]
MIFGIGPNGDGLNDGVDADLTLSGDILAPTVTPVSGTEAN